MKNKIRLQGRIKFLSCNFYNINVYHILLGGNYMKYQELMEKSDNACKKAIKFAKKRDWKMATFWKNASIGYKEKALKLNK